MLTMFIKVYCVSVVVNIKPIYLLLQSIFYIIRGMI